MVKDIKSFFGNHNKRKSPSEVNASKKQKHVGTVDASSTNFPSPEREVQSDNTEVLSASASSSTTEVLVTASKTFSDDILTVPSHGLNDISPTQKVLKKYPARKFGTTSRSFNSTWYKGKPWLEYSVATDSAYCFPCRVYGVNPSTPKFCIEGYEDWKHALDGWNELEKVEQNSSSKKNLKGFAKHVASGFHKKNMEAWMDKDKREKSGKTIQATAVKIKNEHKIWLEVVFNVIRSLAADGLPLR